MDILLETIAKYTSFVLDLVSILIMVLSGIKALYTFVKSGFKFNNMRVSLIIAEGLTMSLGFLLAAENHLKYSYKDDTQFNHFIRYSRLENWVNFRFTLGNRPIRESARRRTS